MRRSNVKRASSAEAVGSVLAAAVPAPPTRDSRVCGVAATSTVFRIAVLRLGVRNSGLGTWEAPKTRRFVLLK